VRPDVGDRSTDDPRPELRLPERVAVPGIYRLEPPIGGSIERDVARGDEYAAVGEELLLDAPHLRAGGRVPRDEFAVVPSWPGMAQHLRPPVRGARDVAHLVCLVVHAHVVRGHVEQLRLWRIGSGLLVFAPDVGRADV